MAAFTGVRTEYIAVVSSANLATLSLSVVMPACWYASPCPRRTIYRPSPLRRSPSHQPYVELLLTRRAARRVFSLQRLKIVPPPLLHVYQRELFRDRQRPLTSCRQNLLL